MIPPFFIFLISTRYVMLQDSVNGQLNAGNISRGLYFFHLFFSWSRGSGSSEACDRFNLHKAQFSTLAFTRVVVLEAFF